MDRRAAIRRILTAVGTVLALWMLVDAAIMPSVKEDAPAEDVSTPIEQSAQDESPADADGASDGGEQTEEQKSGFSVEGVDTTGMEIMVGPPPTIKQEQIAQTPVAFGQTIAKDGVSLYFIVDGRYDPARIFDPLKPVAAEEGATGAFTVVACRMLGEATIYYLSPDWNRERYLQLTVPTFTESGNAELVELSASEWMMQLDAVEIPVHEQKG